MKLYINENQINLLKNTELSGKTKYYVNCGITDTLHPILEGVKHEEMDEYMIGGEGDANGFMHVVDENCKLHESNNHIVTYYRGFDSRYDNFGSKRGLWVADDYDYAKEYADNEVYGGHGMVVAFEIDYSKLNPCSLYEIDEYLGEEFDPYEPDYCWENGVFDQLLKDGYNCYEMYYDDQSVQGLYLLNNSAIVNSYIVTDKPQIDECITCKISENIDDEMKLYHGSVSDFDAFNLDFAHSGEGYEVYGFGVYATTIDETAHFYAKIAKENSDIEVRFGGEEPHNASESIVASYLKETEGNIIKAIQNVWELNKLEDSDKAKEASNILLACYNKKDNGYLKFSKPSRMIYEVEVPNDDGENYIDWKNDSQEKLTRYAKEFGLNGKFENFGEIYSSLAEKFGSTRKASEFLRSMGYIGTKVLTRMGDGINYAIFDTNDIKILGKTNIDKKINESAMRLNEGYGNNINYDEVNMIEFKCWYDEDDYNDFLKENGINSNNIERFQSQIGEWMYDNLNFDCEFYDRDYQYIGGFDEPQSMFEFEGMSDELSELIVNTFKKNPRYDKEYRIDDVLYTLYSDSDDIYEAAKKLFPTYNEYTEGLRGFILQDGTIIGTEAEHNEVTQLKGIESKFDFIRLGNIRIMPNSIDVGEVPSWSQREILRSLIATYSDDELYLDLFDERSGTETGCRYFHPSWREVLADIDRFYYEGIKPSGGHGGMYESRDILKENVTDIVYHFTTLEGLIYIINDDAFESKLFGKNGMFKFSFTRQRSSEVGYGSYNNLASLHKEEMNRCLVRLTIDGRELGYNYKSVPYDFFGDSNPTYKEKMTKGNETAYTRVESEDCVLSRNSTIPNALRYIMKIDILFRPNFHDEGRWFDEYYHELDELNELGVNASVFFDENEFNKLNGKGMSIESAMYEMQEIQYDFCGEEEEIYESINNGVIFPNSKVRNEDGSLKVMYRGDSKQIDSFDREYSSSSNLYGTGFYFTDAESHAMQYGNPTQYYLNIEHPLSTDGHEITKEQLYKFLVAVDENEDYGLYNYGYGSNPNTVLSSVWGKSDFAMLLDINACCIGDLVEATLLFNEVNNTDFDGFILDTETVVFDNSQIKRVGIVESRKCITETNMQTLYHYISLYNLNKMIDNNVIRMSTAEGEELSLSLTRVRTNQEGFQYGIYGKCKYNNYARIQFNGEALKRIKGSTLKPFDFVNAQDPEKQLNGKGWHNQYNSSIFSSYYNLPKDDEMSSHRHFWSQSEERLKIADKFISNPLKYIERIDVMIQNPDGDDALEFYNLLDKNQQWKNVCFIHSDDKSFNKPIGLSKISENLDYEVAPSEVDLSSFELEDTLEPNIWKNGELNSMVRLKLLEVADDFIETLGVRWVKPKDIILTGSICNYNWSSYSDIDMHIVFDYTEIDKKTNLVSEYFDAKKNEWNNEHYELTIYGYPIEIYVQDIDSIDVSDGVYSLEKNEWIKHPTRGKFNNLSDTDESKVKLTASSIMTYIDDLEEKFKETDDSHILEELDEEINELLDKLKKIRNNGLEKDGEMSLGNIVYKELRREEYLDKLWNLKTKIYDRLNSI